MSGRLTTHVLDISCGRPANGVKVELWKYNSSGSFEKVNSSYTNSDGRLDEPLLNENTIEKGRYELVFYVGEYFQRMVRVEQEFPFLDQVPIRFGIANVEVHYHVPLLIAPGGYSTYRGS